MKVSAKWILFVLPILLIVGVGIRTDIDYCQYTGSSIHSTRLWGLTLSKRESDGYRSWLKDEIGLELETDFVDFLNFHPLRAVASTPPGNWLTLSRARQIHDDYPSTRDQVKKILLRRG
jgi:hypothetical protein